MRRFFEIVLLVINIVSGVLVSLFGATGIIYDLFGPASYLKMLEKFKISWSFECVWLFMYASLIILILSYFLRKKLEK